MLSTTVKYEYLIAGLAFAMLYLIWSMLIKPSLDKKKIKEELDKIASYNNYQLVNVQKRNYDFYLQSNGNAKYAKIFVRVLFVPRISTITINSKDTWELHYGGSNKPGSSYPNKRYLNELTSFLRMNASDNELKLILVYKGTLKVQKYLNESEIAIVKNKEKVYDYKIVNFEELFEHFQDL